MKNLYLLFIDELTGFYKSGVMIALWILMPVIGILMYFLVADQLKPPMGGDWEFPMTYMIGLVLSSLAAQITGVMLTVNIINEKQRKVYDIFVIRPIKRWHLLVSKFAAVFICVGLACVLALFAGILVDTIRGDAPSYYTIKSSFESLLMSLGIIGTLSAVGILFGVVTDSILVGVILIIFLGGYVTYFPALPPILGLPNSTLWSVLLGGTVTAILLGVAGYIFGRKQL